jgi:hypothetical protein
MAPLRNQSCLNSVLVLISSLRKVSSFHQLSLRKPSQAHILHFTTMTNSNSILSRVTPENIALEIKDPVDAMALQQAKAIISEIRTASGKIDADKLLEVGLRLGDLQEGPIIVSPDECKAAFDGLDDAERKALMNIHARVKAFAEAQRKSVVDMEIDIPGGKAGHTVSPCKGK